MKRIKKLLSLLLCGTVIAAGLGGMPASAADSSQTLRVGLTINGESSFADPKLENVSGFATGYNFGTMNDTTFAGTSETASTQLTIRLVDNAFQVSDTETGSVVYTSEAGADHLAIHPKSEQTWFRGYKWYGDFVYRRASSGGLTVINYVALEDYVKGVLPYEIDPDWPAEAQKAQAVCARSFALGTHKHTAQGYDLCNTTNCQVYLGTNRATAASDAAVEATRGEYLVYNGEPVIGYFYSSDGGATEDAANVWGGDYPYLKGKADPYETHNDPWTVTLTADEVRQKLVSAGYSIGTVANVEVTRRTANDNVNEVTVTDTTGKQIKIERSSTRTVFGLKSIRYTITPNGAAAAQPQRLSLRVVPSTHAVTVDGESVSPQGYNIDGNNYYKLRDIAYILNGTDKQFNVSWDNAERRIRISSGRTYETVGGEMTDSTTAKVESVAASDAQVMLDGKEVTLKGYLVNGNNYYRVRDVGQAMNFFVDFADDVVIIESRTATPLQPQTPQQPEAPQTPPQPEPQQPEVQQPQTPTVTNAVSYTFTGTGWGHSVGMSQWGAHAMALQGFDYEEILAFYFTGVTVAG